MLLNIDLNLTYQSGFGFWKINFTSSQNNFELIYPLTFSPVIFINTSSYTLRSWSQALIIIIIIIYNTLRF